MYPKLILGITAAMFTSVHLLLRPSRHPPLQQQQEEEEEEEDDDEEAAEAVEGSSGGGATGGLFAEDGSGRVVGLAKLSSALPSSPDFMTLQFHPAAPLLPIKFRHPVQQAALLTEAHFSPAHEDGVFSDAVLTELVPSTVWLGVGEVGLAALNLTPLRV
eukprot:CAMPEP_0177775888 /NCGR_PEP_ID=MMETSP0491_2-20121128/14380_1 /TAXON_ID=63592 /ORGANISM="Tetraselmis chuii, Strain PLY429" /LENGTH=159 /DNA_ID=CAMNT_0019294563 /DNA_START=151 /DNA_END=631 /DNA_ORIENTATION=-